MSFSALSPNQTQELDKPISDSEIDLAIKSLSPWKALGLDGFPARFYQRHWNLIKQDIYNLIWGWFEGTIALEQFNHTLLTLIPKSTNPQTSFDWRPISLCDTSHKILSKVPSLRLKNILPEILDPCQGAFAKGRGAKTMLLWYLNFFIPSLERIQDYIMELFVLL